MYAYYFENNSSSDLNITCYYPGISLRLLNCWSLSEFECLTTSSSSRTREDRIKIKDVSILSSRSTNKLASSKCIPSIIRNALQDNISDFTLTNNSNSIHNSAPLLHTWNISVSVLKYWTWIRKAVITRPFCTTHSLPVFKSLKVIMAFPFRRMKKYLNWKLSK